MDLAADIRAGLGDDWLPHIYDRKVRSGRSRSLSIDVPQRENSAVIEYTLLGIELQVGKRRFACPDLATARYMRVFARIGCSDFAIPYDITKISGIADELETSWQRTILRVDQETSNRSKMSAAQTRSRLIRAIREELQAIGAGEHMPVFDRKTRQRK